VVSHPVRLLTSAGVGSLQPQPRFLDGVVGLCRRAQDPEGGGTQVGTAALELSCHYSTSSMYPASRNHHLIDDSTGSNVTRRMSDDDRVDTVRF
jgi:hypothetical protein